MTMLVSWLCIDTHGPTSAYIASDSRFSTRTDTFDYGKKVFASKTYPELFGYAGDVLFPSVVLSQIVEMIDNGLLLKPEYRCDKKNSVIFERICNSLVKYQPIIGEGTIEIIHISRDTIASGYPQFFGYRLSWSRKTGFITEKINMPSKSDVLTVSGSGAKEFNENYKFYQLSPNQSTSRNVFHCFINTLDNIKDRFCGGAPQLIGIYRKPFTGGRYYGIVYKNKRYFLGMEVPMESDFANVEWRNELFEICDGESKKIAEGAMRQPDLLH